MDNVITKGDLIKLIEEISGAIQESHIREKYKQELEERLKRLEQLFDDLYKIF